MVSGRIVAIPKPSGPLIAHAFSSRKYKFGDSCKYSHLPEHTGRTAAGELTRARKREEAAAGPAQPKKQPKAKPKAEPKADPSGAQGRGRGKGGTKGGEKNEFTKNGTPKKQILCKYVKDGKKCPLGDKCLYGHRRKNFDAGGQYI